MVSDYVDRQQKNGVANVAMNFRRDQPSVLVTAQIDSTHNAISLNNTGRFFYSPMSERTARRCQVQRAPLDLPRKMRGLMAPEGHSSELAKFKLRTLVEITNKLCMHTIYPILMVKTSS